jgi:serine/threonine protein kinase
MAVSTTESFLDLLAASNLLSRAQIEMLRANAGDDPKQFATRLVKQNLLTRWQASQLLSGKSKLILGRYKLLEAIGRGGMGTVLKAEQIGIGREVALKLMSKAVLKNPDAVTRFLREIRSAAALNHPNIVAAYDASSEGSQYFLVMEYVNGRDLKEWIRKHRRLPIDWACECVRQAAEGLQHAHEHGMVHRDIKPANLLVVTEADGTKPVVKILDMGLARFTSENTGTDAGLTQTGQVMGTPDYIAPEQARNTRDADIRSDIFSLGCTLFELLAGEVPYGGQNVMEKLMARAVDDAPRVRSRRPEIPAELDRIVARMLARDANDRFQTPGEVAAALAPFAAGGTGAKQSPPPIAAPEAARTTGSAARDSTLNEFLDQLGDTAPGTARATAENQPVEQKRRGARKPAEERLPPWC